MKHLIIFLILILTFSSCKSSKRAKTKNSYSTKIITKKNGDYVPLESTSTKSENPDNTRVDFTNTKAANIIEFAKQFEGVRYKWGGTTAAGMDCSGLIYESFRVHEVYLPRISRDMAKRGKKISLKNVNKGDLLFFKTSNRRNSINHVGLIISIRNNNIEFIHATSGNGVMISWLNEEYWLKAFKEARRIL